MKNQEFKLKPELNQNFKELCKFARQRGYSANELIDGLKELEKIKPISFVQ
nr:MAG TPA: hypothetical protein [Caudoviricetes sp.]